MVRLDACHVVTMHALASERTEGVKYIWDMYKSIWLLEDDVTLGIFGS